MKRGDLWYNEGMSKELESGIEEIQLDEIVGKLFAPLREWTKLMEESD